MLQNPPASGFAPTPLIRLLWVAMSVVLISSVSVLITGAAVDEGAERAQQSERDGGGDAPGAQGGGGDVGAPQGSATTAPAAAPGPPVPTTAPAKQGSAAAPSGAPAAPRLNGEPLAGTYRYRTTTKIGDEPPENGEGTTRFETTGTEASGTHQRVTAQQGEMGSAQETVWSKGTMHVVEQTFDFGGMGGRCRWEPPLLMHQAPMKTGSSWRGESTCKVTVNANTFTVHMVEDAKVVGAETIKVGGVDVKVFVIERSSTQTAKEGGYRGTNRTTERFSSELGLVARAHAEGTFTAFGRSSNYTSDQELVSTKPS